MAVERRHHNATLAVLTLAATAYALQQTMVVPALPELQRSLDASTTWVTWVFTGFLLSAAVSTPILGKLGDRFGKERLLVLSLCGFFLGTVGCALAWDIGSLIAFRAASGAGAAVFPLSFGIIRDEFPPEKMKVGMGLLSAVFGIGGGFGLVFAGLIIDNLSWRWLFIAGAIPVGVSVVLVHKLVPESPVRSQSRIDLAGGTLLSGTLVALLVALSEGQSWGWTSERTLGLCAASVVLGALFAVTELRVAEPLIDMKVFVERPVLLTNVTALIAGFAMFGAYSLLPRFIEAPAGLSATVAAQVHYGFGASATRTGLYLVPSSVMMLFAGPIAGLLGRRFGSKWPLSAGMLFVSLGAGLLAAWNDHPWQIVIAMGALGTGIAFAFASMAALITEAVLPTETGIATGINTVMRTIGAVIGGQVGAAILTSTTIGTTGVPTESAYATMFLLSCGAALIAAGVAVFVSRRGRERAAVGVQDDVKVMPTELLADAVEQLVTVIVRQPRMPGDDEPGELSTFQGTMLAVLADGGGQRLGSLALALGTTDATASRTVDVLEGLRLVARRPDELDGRCIVVAATDVGLEVVRARRARLEKLVGSLVAGLSAEDGERLVELLTELRELLRGSA